MEAATLAKLTWRIVSCWRGLRPPCWPRRPMPRPDAAPPPEQVCPCRPAGPMPASRPATMRTAAQFSNGHELAEPPRRRRSRRPSRPLPTSRCPSTWPRHCTCRSPAAGDRLRPSERGRSRGPTPGAKVLWLPNLNVGTDYYRHEGTDQSTDGTIILDDKPAFAAGGGATLNFGVTDAISSRWRRARLGRPTMGPPDRPQRRLDAGGRRPTSTSSRPAASWPALDAVARAEELVRKTAGLARGLVPEIEVDRRRALLFNLRQGVVAARANWRIASSRLTQILRLNPGAVVVPVEPPHLQVTLISPRLGSET